MSRAWQRRLSFVALTLILWVWSWDYIDTPLGWVAVMVTAVILATVLAHLWNQVA